MALGQRGITVTLECGGIRAGDSSGPQDLDSLNLVLRVCIPTEWGKRKGKSLKTGGTVSRKREKSWWTGGEGESEVCGFGYLDC